MNVVKTPLLGDGGIIRHRAPERNVTERRVGHCRAQPARCERSRISRASGAGAGAGTERTGSVGDGPCMTDFGLEGTDRCLLIDGMASTGVGKLAGEVERKGDAIVEGECDNAAVIGAGRRCGGGSAQRWTSTSVLSTCRRSSIVGICLYRAYRATGISHLVSHTNKGRKKTHFGIELPADAQLFEGQAELSPGGQEQFGKRP